MYVSIHYTIYKFVLLIGCTFVPLFSASFHDLLESNLERRRLFYVFVSLSFNEILTCNSRFVSESNLILSHLKYW